MKDINFLFNFQKNQKPLNFIEGAGIGFISVYVFFTSTLLEKKFLGTRNLKIKNKNKRKSQYLLGKLIVELDETRPSQR